VGVDSDDVWMRDIGPTFVVDGGRTVAVDWQFNAWGGASDGMMANWERDDRAAERIARFHGLPRVRAPLVLEGGSIHSDGAGTIYTTEECLLHPNRNPSLDRAQIEVLLGSHVGARKVVWLPSGLFMDTDTNGHVDNILHVVEPGHVLLTWCADSADPQHARSLACRDLLERERDARGERIRVTLLPMPGPLYMTAEEVASFGGRAHHTRQPGVRLAASYANFLVSNQVVLFPLLDPARDDDARAVLRSVFPDHHIVGLPNAREILLGGGNIHCMTCQVI